MLTIRSSKIQNPRPKGQSKIQNHLPWFILLLIIVGQFNYLPARLDYVRQLAVFAHAKPAEAARLAYQPASYDLLVWVEQHTTPDTTLLLLTASPRTYGNPAYVLYHRALYHLYPRPVWWAAPVPANRYPAWWLPTDLTEANILTLAEKHGAGAILADGFAQPPIYGTAVSFDEDTHLIFLENKGQGPGAGGQQLAARPATEGSAEWVSGLPSAVGGLLLSFGAILSIWLWGDVLYRLTLYHLAGSWPLRLAVGWLLGCGITSLATFLLLWLGLSLTPAVIGLSLLGCLLWLYTHQTVFDLLHSSFENSPHPRRWRDSPSPTGRGGWGVLPCSPAPLLLLTFLTLQIALVAFAAWASPLADWDAWVNWAGKANAIFIDQTLSPNLYHHPARLPTNMDYPLLLPLVEAWFYTWLGRLYEPAVNLISFLFYLALLLLFYHAARRLAAPTPALGFTLLLATLPRLERPAATGLADIPLAALVLLSFLLLFEWQRFSICQLPTLPPFHPSTLPTLQPSNLLPCSPAPLLPLSLSIALLPWLKNEGWLWWSLITLSLLVSLLWQVRRNHLPPRKTTFLFLISYFLPALLLPLLWQLFLTLFGTYRFTFLPLTLPTFWTNLNRLPAISWHMLARLLNPYWNFVWLLAGLILLTRQQRCLAAPGGWLILPVIGFLGLASLSYVFSRFDPFLAHLNNSAERLILQAAPLALWWLMGQSVALGWVKGNEGTEGTQGT
jgi:hypothetical protein